MPKVEEDATPQHLKPYLSMGVDLQWGDGKEEATADCPLCGKEGDKFGVKVETGQYKCFVCGEAGNAYTFLRELHARSFAATPSADYATLAADRRLLSADTLINWGACRSTLTGEWLVPGYSAEGKVVQLYRYSLRSGRMVLLATAGLGHGVFGMDLRDPARPEVYVCEGPWDGMALWEVLRGVKRGAGGGLVPTGSEASSLLAGANVLAVPGCTTFPASWAALTAGKDARLMYDNDHPKERPGGRASRAGHDGMRRVAGVLSGAEALPERVQYLRWGPEGHDPDLPDGHDVRDALCHGGAESIAERADNLSRLLERVVPVPDDWVVGKKRGAGDGSVEVDCLPCDDWGKLVGAWRRAMKWTDGLEYALGVMLASAATVQVVGDQLWVMVLSPPSSGKSVLCEALSVNREHVKAISVFKGFYSGYQIDKEGSQNLSFALQLKGKAFVLKDGDSLLTLPNKDEVMGQARDLYDTTGRFSAKNLMSLDAKNLRFAWILCGTKSLRKLDHSELGERFLTCRIMDAIDVDLEADIAWRKINSVRNNRFEVNGDLTTTETKEMLTARRMTGGYLRHLRTSMGDLYPRVDMDDSAARLCAGLAEFVACMRARPSEKQDEEESGREMSARLVGQFGKLALSLAVVYGVREVGDKVLTVCRRVALDTAKGRVFRICGHLHRAAEVGMTTGGLASHCGSTDLKKDKLMQHLRTIGVVEKFAGEGRYRGTVRWRLSERMSRLYGQVVLGVGLDSGVPETSDVES